MYLDIATKAKSLFKNFPQVSDPETAAQTAVANPLFSWHVSTVQKNKFIVFDNDGCSLRVVIKSSTNQAQVEADFWAMLEQVWLQWSLDKQLFDQYRAKAKPFAVIQNMNRTVAKILSNSIRDLNDMKTKPDDASLLRLSSLLTDAPQQINGVWQLSNTLDTQVTADKLVWHQPKIAMQSPEVVAAVNTILKIQNDRDYLMKQSTAQLNKTRKQLRQANQQLIESYSQSLHLQYITKTVTSHKKDLVIFLNDNLSPRLMTLFSPDLAEQQSAINQFSDTSRHRVRKDVGNLLKLLGHYQLIDSKSAKSLAAKLTHAQSAEQAERREDLQDAFNVISDYASGKPHHNRMALSTSQLLTQYFEAFANLYGDISLFHAIRIIQLQNPTLSLQPFELDQWLTEQVQNDQTNRYDVLYFEIGDAKIATIASTRLLDQPDQILMDLFSSQQNKPYYVPKKSDLLKYVNPNYVEPSLYQKQLTTVLVKNLGLNMLAANNVLSQFNFKHRRSISNRPAVELSDFLTQAQVAGADLSSDEDLNLVLAALQGWLNDIRLWANRGFKPTELWGMQLPIDQLSRQPKLNRSIRKNIANGSIDSAELISTIEAEPSITAILKKRLTDEIDKLTVPVVKIPGW
ncbi:hypothetical protein N692_03640 [Lactiplantibacillus plantarum EGD-AQ4]|nr:hypothetical protein N692_03640 [Lactiplantibacillus plantarum EGD-AQ4]